MRLIGPAVTLTLVGRDELLAELRARLDRDGQVLLTGPDGAGKTALLDAVVAGTDGPCLRAGAVPADVTTPYSLVAEVLGAVPAEFVAALPGPQRAAVHAVLRLADPAPGQPDRLALRIAVATLLHRTAPALIVVDDAQWADPDSVAVLGHAHRRTDPHIPLLVAERNGCGGPGRALCPSPVTELGVPPLNSDDVAAFLEAHGLPCRLVGPVHAASGGNPYLMLEIGRAVAAGAGSTRPLDDVALPERLRDLIGARLAAVPPAVLATLLPAALTAAPTVALLRRAGRADAAEELAVAEAAGLVTVSDGGAVAFTAGVLATALAAEASWDERTSWHAALADLAADPLDRIRHRALATDVPDEELAEELCAAGRSARDRARSAELHILAAERTPLCHPEGAERRLLTAAEEAGHAGRTDLARWAADALLARATAPAVRVRAHLAIVDAAGQALDDLDETFARAIADAADEPALLAAVHLRLAWRANLSEGSPQRARAEAARAATLAAQGGDRVIEAMALTMQARVERILGVPDSARTLQRALACDAPEAPMGLRNTPSYLAARHAVYDDQLPEARAALLGLLPVAERTGAEDLIEVLRSLAEVEAKSGRCAAALDHAHRAVAVSEEAGLSPGPSWFTMAQVEATGGSFARAAGYAERGAHASEEEHDVVFLSRNLHVSGLVKLVTGDATGAVTALRRVRELETAGYVLDPALLRWHADLATAYVAAGDPDEGYALIAATRLTALALDRPGVLAALSRAEGIYRAALGDAAGAVDLLDRAALDFALLGLPVEHGRTLLALGQVEKRRRRRGAARDVLTAALEAFEQTGARPWVTLAATALDRLESGPAEPRAAVTQPLTGTEARIAELVGQGASNREVAATLFLSVKTVEATLTRVYRKLGVRSRTQLSTLLRSG
ncbi:transcriptional regulator [Longispora fulva]|uniref:DNA-binding CsgD family transcriptional regulator n=1 Tax=Longispora fulva TaxID=619741 RepID=A0A8J7GQ17_9ACTN|nr:LuxR family transcriptional regulator [Longispora fulva]MBG6141218.1 DNA-binding CsgD family transcriptional regulator [Longispora fulva]GIG62786.1 transcriptional regulator [Longispora fulva]